MISLARKTSGRRLALISVGILFYATSALAAKSAFDPQDQARQFIVAKPTSESVVDSKTNLTAPGSAQGNGRADPQEQARQFILAKPNLGIAVDSKPNLTAAGSVQGTGRVDPQEQARQFILAKANVGSLADHWVAPVSKKQVTSAVSARRNRGGHSESR